MDWLSALKERIENGCPAALVTIADARGSAPREAGVKMLVTEAETIGTVGGGNLEYEATRIARAMLADGTESSALRQFALGPSLGQCCGGNTTLLFDVFPGGYPLPAWIDCLISATAGTEPSVLISAVERSGLDKLVVRSSEAVRGAFAEGRETKEAWPASVLERAKAALRTPGRIGTSLCRSDAGELFFFERNRASQGDILLIGAGHVGKALAEVLAPLPFHLTWADNRPEQFPDDIAAATRVRCTPHLEKAIDEAAAGTIFLVMSYSHDLDYALCAHVLRRGDFRYLGLIGSATKRARFEKTMADLGLDQALISRVVCPIGIEGIDSKLPSVIALATAAQLLQLPPV